MNQQCPCGSLVPYQNCCHPLHGGARLAGDAKLLMKSRYCAFATLAVDYLVATHSPQTRDTISKVDIAQWAKSCQWLALDVINFSQTATTAQVEFVAWYKENGKVQCLHDLSHFTLEPVDPLLTAINDQPMLKTHAWYYHSSTPPKIARTVPKRNDACICGSGKKFKKCCDS